MKHDEIIQNIKDVCSEPFEYEARKQPSPQQKTFTIEEVREIIKKKTFSSSLECSYCIKCLLAEFQRELNEK